jgi:signal transduction histidine kinase/CheY-like chemotaxis protein
MLLDFVERLLAAAMGASTARALLAALLKAPRDVGGEVAMVLDQTSNLVRFNRELLHATLDHLGKAVSVIDANQRLVAWNRHYIDLFTLPMELLRIGEPVENIVRFNAERGLLGDGDMEEEIERRMHFLRERSQYRHERVMPDGRILEIAGRPMPGGGFISTFADITDYKRVQSALQESNISLESRVRERTLELERLNEDLHVARADADKANLSKTRFLAAASHDLMQPLNAARLFASAAGQAEITSEKLRSMLSNVELSMDSMEELLDSLLDISKLDAGVLPVKIDDVALGPLFDSLLREFSILAERRGLKFSVQPTTAWARTDPALFKRILQNFIANALKYTGSGRVLLGVRRLKGELRIEVLDTGPGIDVADLESIFEEFHRLDVRRAGVERGVGLGLSICKRVAELLEHNLEVRSIVGQGSAFCVTVPVGVKRAAKVERKDEPPARADRLKGVKILCVDNDPDVLGGMAALLESWGCQTVTAIDESDALERLKEDMPEMVVADFHLDNNRTGVQLLAALNAVVGRKLPGIIVTADHTDEASSQAADAGYRVLRKPIRPAAFRAILSKLR